MWYFGQLAGPLYEGGTQGLSTLVTDTGLLQAVEDVVRPLSFINAAAHSKLLWALVACTLLSLLCLAALVNFSAGHGTIANPGAALFAAGLPGMLLWRALDGWLEGRAQAQVSAGAQDAVQAYTQLAVDVLPLIAQKALQVYTFVLGFGLALLLVALLAALFGRRRQSQTPIEPPAAPGELQ
jgi:hypothetical protein